MTQNESIEIKHIFKNGSCVNCGIIEEYAEHEPCEEEDTDWIYDQMSGTREADD